MIKTNQNKSFVLACLPRAGMGNQLLVWAKAYIFATNNNLPLVVTGWNTLRIGPWLRGEKIKRFYGFYFNHTPWSLKTNFFISKRLHKFQRITEPTFNSMIDSKLKAVYIFDTPFNAPYFDQLTDYKSLLSAGMQKLVKKKYIKMAENIKAADIGAHIRLSDFRQLKENEQFNQSWGVRTPLTYFITEIERIRNKKPGFTSVRIFTDGYKDELTDILSLPDVELAENNPDIVDLLLLSRSRTIIPSFKSSFSYWAAFLSDAEIIFHPSHQTKPF